MNVSKTCEETIAVVYQMLKAEKNKDYSFSEEINQLWNAMVFLYPFRKYLNGNEKPSPEEFFKLSSSSIYGGAFSPGG